MVKGWRKRSPFVCVCVSIDECYCFLTEQTGSLVPSFTFLIPRLALKRTMLLQTPHRQGKYTSNKVQKVKYEKHQFIK